MAHRSRAVALALTIALTVAACGSDGASTVAGPTTTGATAPPTTATDGRAPSTTPGASTVADLPAIDVVDLATGEEVDLQSLAQPGRPTLLWFWAPHCTTCRREAPDVLAFEAAHADQIDLLGLGAQDTLDEAYGFLDDTGTHDLTMVWDRSGQSWIHHGVTSQPTVIVLDASGEVAGTWFRDFDVDGILAAAGLA